MWLLHVVWASSQQGSFFPKASSQRNRESKVKAALHFMTWYVRVIEVEKTLEDIYVSLSLSLSLSLYVYIYI